MMLISGSDGYLEERIFTLPKLSTTLKKERSGPSNLRPKPVFPVPKIDPM